MKLNLLLAGLLAGIVLSLVSGIGRAQAFHQSSSKPNVVLQVTIWSVQLQQEEQSSDKVLIEEDFPTEAAFAMLLIFVLILGLGKLDGGGGNDSIVGDGRIYSDRLPDVERYKRRGEPIIPEDYDW